MKIELHIERLILVGLQVDRAGAADVHSAVEAELTRLLTADALKGNLLSGGALRSIDAGEIRISNQPPTALLGINIAQAVHSGITHTGRPNV